MFHVKIKRNTLYIGASTAESHYTKKQGKISLYSSSLFCPPVTSRLFLLLPLPFPIQLLSLSLIVQFRFLVSLTLPFIFSHLYSRSVAAPTHRLLYSFNPLFQHQPLCDVSFWLRQVSRGCEDEMRGFTRVAKNLELCRW